MHAYLDRLFCFYKTFYGNLQQGNCVTEVHWGGGGLTNDRLLHIVDISL